MKKLPALLLLCVLLTPIVPLKAFAEDGVIPLAPGQPAPRQGYFVDEEHMKEGLRQAEFVRTLLKTNALEVKSLRDQMKVAIETEKNLGKERLENERAKGKIEIDAVRARNEALEKENYDLKNPPFYKTQWFSATSVAVLGLIVRVAF